MGGYSNKTKYFISMESIALQLQFEEWAYRHGYESEAQISLVADFLNGFEASRRKSESSLAVLPSGVHLSKPVREAFYHAGQELAGLKRAIAESDINGSWLRNLVVLNSSSPTKQATISKGENASYIRAAYTVTTGKTFSNVITYPMIYKGTEGKPFESYGASPSLDYPSEVEAVGDNVNILANNAVSTNANGVNYTVNKNGSIYAVGTANGDSHIYLAGDINVQEKIDTLYKGVSYKNVCNVDIIYRDTNLKYVRIIAGNVFTAEEDVPVGCWYLQVNNGDTVDEIFYPKLVKYYEGIDESYSLYGQGSVEITKNNKNMA